MCRLPLEKRARVSVTRFTVTTVQPGTQTQQNGYNNRLKALGTILMAEMSRADVILLTGDNLYYHADERTA